MTKLGQVDLHLILQPCSANDDSVCDPRFVCNEETSTCQPPGSTGDVCAEAADCASPLDCGSDDYCGGVNAVCSQNQDSHCDTGNLLVCNSEVGSCQPRQNLVRCRITILREKEEDIYIESK